MSDTVDQKPVEQKIRSESYPPAKKLTESETAQSKALYSSEKLRLKKLLSGIITNFNQFKSLFFADNGID